MPSDPHPAPKRVRVRHVSTGVEKEVLRIQWERGLGPHWKRASGTRKKRPPAEAVEPTEPAVESDTKDKE